MSVCISVSCSSYFHGCCSLTLATGDDCIRATAVSHHHALCGFRAAFALLSTSELPVFAWPAAVSEEWVHLVRRDTGGRCSRGRIRRKWGIQPPCNSILASLKPDYQLFFILGFHFFCRLYYIYCVCAYAV